MLQRPRVPEQAPRLYYTKGKCLNIGIQAGNLPREGWEYFPRLLYLVIATAALRLGRF